MPKRSAVIGVGGAGRKHVRVFHDLTDLVCVCDVNEEAAAHAAEGTNAKVYTDAEEMFRSEQLEVVSVCTPPKLHFHFTQMAAEQGAGVLVEKPMANTVENCQKMVDTCRDKGVTLMIAHKKRFLPPVSRLKELLARDFGPAKYVLHKYPHPGMSQKGWFWDDADGGGPILENAVHAADIMRYLAGDVERVYAEGSTAFAEQRAPVINCAVYTIRFKSGAIGSVGAGMVSSPALGTEEYFIATDAGVAEVSGGFDSSDTIRYAFRNDPKDVKEEQSRDFDPFVLEISHFLECVDSGAEPLTSGYEGMKAVELCLAVKQSARENRPVTLG